MHKLTDTIISIHAPRTGSDDKFCCQEGIRAYFNPRSPHGERHGDWYDAWDSGAISIHAPRTGSDASALACPANIANFNPRSPHGERPHRRLTVLPEQNFNPRSPHGERPTSTRRCSTTSLFQSTLPARGATRGSGDWQDDHQDFNPRSPHGERRMASGSGKWAK